jgi:hypothetical protein
MKIIRSSKCSLKFANKKKLDTLRRILTEYGVVVNAFIEMFWFNPPRKIELRKDIINRPNTWLSFRFRKVAAREAIDMIKSSRRRYGEEAVRPTHKGQCMYISSAVASLVASKHTSEFDAWLHLHSMGMNIILDLPVKFHKHYNTFATKGKRLESYIVTIDNVQFAFEIETGLKYKSGKMVGVDTGIKALASTSNGVQFGRDITRYLDRINGCKHGSKGQKRARRALKQRMDEVAKELFDSTGRVRLIVVEKLKNLNHKTRVKRRLTKNMRRSIGSWAWRYWLDRLQRECENRRSAFRSVPAYYTSQTCPSCGHVDRKNRNGEVFLCRKCGHADNADINAARNILFRFITGPYGAGFKPRTLVA